MSWVAKKLYKTLGCLACAGSLPGIGALSAAEPGPAKAVAQAPATKTTTVKAPAANVPAAKPAAAAVVGRKEPAKTLKSNAATKPDPAVLAAQVKELFRSRCLECHGGRAVQGGVKILDRDLLVAREKKVVPGKPDESLLYQLVTANDESAMPPAGQPRLATGDFDLIRQWISAGAPAFPVDVQTPDEQHKDESLKNVVGVDYVLKKILEHVRSLPGDQRVYMRYFSTNHLLTGGATRDELNLHRDALTKAVNHLSREPKLVKPIAIDGPTGTLFAVDIRKLGWHKQPFQRIEGGKPAGHSTLNLFDLALLEYPYAVIYEDSETFDRVSEEYLIPAGLARPIPYVRVDWFVSTATQPPLYEDFLQLPLDVADLEADLGVDTEANLRDHVAKRAGMTVSGVSRSNRVVERHPAQSGAYWKSFDFPSSKGRENMFQDPLHLHQAGGEMIFTLPNHLHGYYLATGTGRRLEHAPTTIVTDKFAEDKTVRNGLSCMRCHDRGIKDFKDTVRPAMLQLPGSPGFSKREVLALYPDQAEMDGYVQEDTERFLAALQQAVGKSETREPLTPVTQRFLEAPLQFRSASAELGLVDPAGLEQIFRSPQFVGLGLVALGSGGGVVRRDMWEDYFGQIVRDLGVGIPVVPLDGLSRPDYQPAAVPFDVELATSKKNNVFAPGDELFITVTNKSKTDLFIELQGTSAKGEKVILAASTTPLKAGQQFRFPEKGALRVQAGIGKEQITLLAASTAFPKGELLRGHRVMDRVVHPFYRLERSGKRLLVQNDVAQFVKKTLEIETK